MYTVSGKSIQEYRQCCNECFSFTCCHFRNLSLMQYDTTKKLDVIMNHIPFHIVTAGHPVITVDSFVSFNPNEIFSNGKFSIEVICCNNYFLVFCKSAGCIFYDAKRYRHNFIEGFFINFKHLFFKLIDLSEYIFTLINRCFFDFCLQFSNLFLLILSRFLNILLNFLCAGTQRVIIKCFNFRICRLDFLN